MLIHTLLSGFFRVKWTFFLMIMLLILAFICEKNYSNRFYNDKDIRKFEKTIALKENKAIHLLEEMQKAFSLDNEGHMLDKIIDSQENLFMNEGIGLFIYHNDSLSMWTTNAIPVPESAQMLSGTDVIAIHNFVCLKKEISVDDYTFLSLIFIRSDYPYENRVLKEGFQKSFSLSKEVEILYPGDKMINPVYNSEGRFLFSLDFSAAKKEDRLKSTLCISLYFLGFFLFLSFLRRLIKYSPKELKNILLVVVILVLFVFYFLAQHYKVPGVIFSLELFSPQKFASSYYLPSLGNLLLITIILFFIIYNVFLEFTLKNDSLKKCWIYRFSIVLLLGVIALVLYYTSIYIFRSLILDSSISFEPFKVLELSAYTFTGFLIIALVFTSYSFLLDKIFGIYRALNYKREAVIFLICISLLAVILFFIPKADILPESLIFFILISFLLYYFKISRPRKYRISTYLIFVILFSAYTVFQVYRFTVIKTASDMKITAMNLSSEHDPVAEMLFVEISERIRTDKELESVVLAPVIDFKSIYGEIQRKYFSGYLDKYDMQMTLCKPEDKVYINPPDDRWEHCYSFFYDIIMQNAIEVPNSDFYFLNNLNGRISYFSAITFYQKKKEITIFIELDSRLLSEGLGYPELLLDEKLFKRSKSNYSYAKYYQGKLITSSGQYPYRTSSASYTSGYEGFELLKSELYDHVIYNIDEMNTIIVTKPSVLYIDLIISFSYVFVFYFFLLIVLLLITNINPLIMGFQWNFKNKIQVVISSVIFFSVLLIGAGTVYLSIRQYRIRQIENLREKVQSVYVELIHKFDFERDLHNWTSDNDYNLELLLQRFSNVFYTDINLYDENGWLLASSRPEIFENGLIGRNLHSVAYVEMIQNQRSEFIHKETIGTLNYLSAYVPFVNADNKLLAYLNLPYFTRQDELTMEIANLVVAIINILLLLTLFSLAIAVFISNTITQPLRLIQEHISRFNLNRNNEKIEYRGKDEIGSLINEYNMMIDQLSESAEKLARSERESAWREMAKQVAHEIKNPLTPMRLILQHLQRSWKEDPESRLQQQEKLSKILIEQIDHLSKIAGEFSNFAKMPVAHNEKVDLVSVVNDTAKLFGNTENINIDVNRHDLEKLFIWADKEQVSRVFINLLKNAIQSIPEGREGRIEIMTEKWGDKVLVRIRDNGKGIAENVRDKLFQPNFTTNTSGMGMGLAIAKNIVNSCGGDIYYETELNKGSVFIVELPLMMD